MTTMTLRRRREEYVEELSLMERVVEIRRVAKVVKGGRHLSFNAMVVVGDGAGRVGIGLGKAPAVPDAVRKGNTIARKNMITVPLKGTTIPHMVTTRFGATNILMKPAPTGAGIIAGGAARAVLELAGVKDVVAKCLGSRNPINVVKATMKSLTLLQDPARELAKRKGLPMPQPVAAVPAQEAPVQKAKEEAPAQPEQVEGEGEEDA